MTHNPSTRPFANGELPGVEPDPQLVQVCQALSTADPLGDRAAEVFRQTFDQLYDGQRTGRYRWEQLYKTEKTHFGTLLEINLRRQFDDVLDDGVALDYSILGYDIDCKYSHKMGGWMIPPEAFGKLLLVCNASDFESFWNMGVVRATENVRRRGSNRDGKSSLTRQGLSTIHWLHRDAPMAPNVLLRLDDEAIQRIFEPRSGQARLNQLFREVINRRIGRNTIATVAQQDDYMKRVRANGGSRTALQKEGIIIPGGDFAVHRDIAHRLGATVPRPGEVVSLKLSSASPTDSDTVELDHGLWRLARDGEPAAVTAPQLPDTRVR